MKRLIAAASLAVLAAAPVAVPDAAFARADDSALPKPASASVYAGRCLTPALNAERDDTKEGGFLGGLLSSVGTTLIGKAFDWLGAQAARLGADERTDITGARASQVQFNDRTCLQIVKFAAKGATLGQLKDGVAAFKGATSDPTLVPMDRPVAFFAEYWVRTSADEAAVSLTPTLLYYPSLLGSKNGVDTGVRLVRAKVGPPGGGGGMNVTWALPKDTAPSPGLKVLLPVRAPLGGKVYRQELAYLKSLCEQACEGASPWQGNPWKDAQIAAKGAAPVTYAVKPVNIEIVWTEIRDGSKFWKGVADLWNANKGAVQTELAKSLFSDKRDAADQAEMTADAAALTAFAAKLQEAETERTDKYCAARANPKANWTALSATLRAKQLAANVAAAAAGQPMPFGPPVAVSDSLNQAVCPA